MYKLTKQTVIGNLSTSRKEIQIQSYLPYLSEEFSSSRQYMFSSLLVWRLPWLYKLKLTVYSLNPLITVFNHLFHLLLTVDGPLQYRHDLVTLMWGVRAEYTYTLRAGLTYKPAKAKQRCQWVCYGSGSLIACIVNLWQVVRRIEFSEQRQNCISWW